MIIGWLSDPTYDDGSGWIRAESIASRYFAVLSRIDDSRRAGDNADVSESSQEMTRNINDIDTDRTSSTASTTEAAAGQVATDSPAGPGATDPSAGPGATESATDADAGDTEDAADPRARRTARDGGASTTEESPQEPPTGSVSREDAGEFGGERSPTEGDAPSEPEPLSLDHVFGVLKNERRRRVLRFLEETEGTVSLSETAERIAAAENDKDVSQISSAERKRVYVGLYQCHLPKMDSMEIVSFNKPRGTIDLGEHADEVFEYLDTDDEESDRSWHAYSATLSGLGLVVLAGAMAVSPMTGLPVVEGAVALILLSFLTYALVGLYSTRAGDADEADR